ncbi:MAG: hypothetical protein QOJ16_2095 [Acidobacteriota bacterium]|nr:hypothetical protein [Acidobacteriota bacterium]
MDTARQVIRWSIPGWILILAITCLEMVTLLAQGHSLQSIATRTSLHELSTAAVALVITAGIPLGFILYQVYYSTYGKVLLFHLVNRDRGAEILGSLPEHVQMKLMIGDVPADLEKMYEEVAFFIMPNPLRRLELRFRNKAGRARYERKVQANWDVVRFWLNYLCIRHDAAPIKQEVTNLADIYHGIGATRTALFAACIVHFVYNIGLTSNSWFLSAQSIFALIAPYLAALWLFRALERTRTHALDSLQSMLQHAFICFFSRKKELDSPTLIAGNEKSAA